jgi:hypothetical protein
MDDGHDLVRRLVLMLVSIRIIREVKTYDDRGEGCLGDPVQSRGKLVQGQNDKGSSEEEVDRAPDTALRVDGGTRHGSTGCGTVSRPVSC